MHFYSAKLSLCLTKHDSTFRIQYLNILLLLIAFNVLIIPHIILFLIKLNFHLFILFRQFFCVVLLYKF